jgi:Mg-chelatase subunit ChlD
MLREKCDPERARADAVLVIDNSSSMEGQKIESARKAAMAFLGAMNLERDQVAVVSFSAEARILSRLSADRDAIEAAIGGIEADFGTQIGEGLAAAQEVLAGPERKPENTPMVILLTDGIQVGDPERPQMLAAELRDAKVELYVVGLGSDVETDYLMEMAGGSARLRLSPGPDDLVAIYEEIAKLIPCSPAAFWGRR